MKIGTTHPKRNWLLLSGVLLLLGSLSLPNIATAQGVGDYLLSILFSFVVSVFGTLAGWAGILLDWAINELVIGFGNLYVTSGLGFTVDAMWVIVRDIFNLTFIFGLVFIGLKMIFGTDNSGQKMLVSLIMAALLVNFSLFITKFVVDFSNIAAVQLVNTFPKKDGVPSISGSFVNAIGLTSLYKVETNGSVAPHANFFSNGSTGGGFIYIFSTMIILLVAAFVFAAGAFLLFIRFALLIFYLILSPLMFLGWVFPGGGSITAQFWSGFLGRAFFAPVYLLLLYLSYQIIIGFKSYPIFQGANFGNLAGAKSSADVFAVLPPFILTAIFLIASVVIAQKMGISGAGGVISMGKAMTGKAKAYAKKGAWASTYVARAPARAATNWAGGKALKSFNNFQAKAQAKASAPGAGRASKIIGWAATTNTTDRLARGTAESLKKAQFGTGTTNDQEEAYAKKVQSNINQTQAENTRSATFKKSESDLANSATTTADLIKALDDLGTTMRSMTKDEKLNIAKDDINRIKNIHVAANLTDDDIEHFEKSGSFSAQQIDDIKNARKAGLTAIAAGGNTFASISGSTISYTHPNATAPGPGGAPIPVIPDRRSTISSQGTQTIGKMPVSVFTQPTMYEYGHLTPSMIEERIKKGVSLKEKADMREALETAMGYPPGSGILPSAVPAAALTSMPWIKQWIKWETSNSFHAANFFT